MDTTLTDPLVGTVLEGRYRLLGRIARGGMSTVYEAIDDRLERTVAVKVMHQGLGDDAAFLARFHAEARAAARLSSPHVVAVFDQGSHDGLAYLVMEYVRGRTLRDLLTERGPLDPGLVLSILDPVLTALAAAHRAGLVHRDVKPENVLIGDDGTVKVADFGLARAVEASATTATRGVLLGTVAYLAPEQVVDGSADERSDVYATGLLAFELLTGEVPFTGDTAMSVAWQHAHDDVPPPSSRVDVPDELDALVQWATRREPGARPADAGVLLVALRHVREDLGLPVVPVPVIRARSTILQPTVAEPRQVAVPPQRAVVAVRRDRGARARPRRRRTGLVVTVLIALLAGLVAAGGWWLGAGRYTVAPSYYGLTQQAAEQRIAADGFTARVGDAEFSETVAKGLVAEQDPGQQQRILRGGTVTLHLSRGPERYTVPRLAGRSQGDAQSALSADHLRSTVSQAFSDSVPAGSVISSDPAAGASLKRDTTVALSVSKGPPPVDVPDVTGTNVDDATQQLSDVGLGVTVTQAYDKTVAEGDVIAQSPTGGTLTKGSKVALTVSKGPPLVDLPDVTGQQRRKAQQTLEDLGFQVRVIGGNGRVVQQSPDGGGQARYGSTITLLALL